MNEAFVPFQQDKLHEAVFLERPNRFILHCRLKQNGQIIRVHLPDPGRLKELLLKGTTVIVSYHNDPKRKTAWSAVMVEDQMTKAMVSLNTQRANQLVEVALQQKTIPKLKAYELINKEFSYGGSRFDFLVSDGSKWMIIEVKSVTLNEEGVGRFPDALTKRGKKHVEELTHIQLEGKFDTMVLFVAQRSDIVAITTADDIDPAFASSVKLAQEKGVRFHGINCHVDQFGIRYHDEIPFH